MYNEFGAIPTNKKRNNNFRLKESRRSNSQGGQASERFSEMSDIPNDDASRFVGNRGSYMGTIDALLEPERRNPPKQTYYRP